MNDRHPDFAEKVIYTLSTDRGFKVWIGLWYAVMLGFIVAV
jgi:hypothetical protein